MVEFFLALTALGALLSVASVVVGYRQMRRAATAADEARHRAE